MSIHSCGMITKPYFISKMLSAKSYEQWFFKLKLAKKYATEATP